MTLGLQPWAIMVALRPIPRPYHYKQSLTYKYCVFVEPIGLVILLLVGVGLFLVIFLSCCYYCSKEGSVANSNPGMVSSQEQDHENLIIRDNNQDQGESYFCIFCF